jgi:hypothetical protein
VVDFHLIIEDRDGNVRLICKRVLLVPSSLRYCPGSLICFTVGASCPLLSLAWSFSEDGHPSRTNAVATDSLDILSGQKLPKLYCLLEPADQKPPGYNDNTVTDIYAHGRSPSGINY